MMKFFKNRIITGVLLTFGLISVQQSFAQDDGSVPYDPSLFIKTEINSGNPAYPYPQFLEYKGGGKSLAKYNAEGVTHADMEKAGREAYEIMMHRCRYEGNYCGVDYISFNRDDVPHNYGTFVSEGDGYALLAAAIFADQKTFNGLYMWVHDIRFAGVKRFRDGKTRGLDANDFAGPYMAAWKDKTFDAKYGSDSHSATDGDVDIAMAMLIAYKQWGEWMMQDGKVVKDSEGNPISLKYETQRVVGALVDTIGQWDKDSGSLTGYLCGVVGVDGYEKRGNSWGELTRWRFTDAAREMYPNINGPNSYSSGPNLYSVYGGNYIDYDAPSYFEEFWRWLKNGDGVDENNEKVAPWEIHQFKRAAASGNWLNKKAYEQGLIGSIGRVDMETDGEPKFGVYVDGEDFRYPWRHFIDYLWHGNADYDWDPKTHQVIEGSNNSEYLMGMRHAEMLKEPSKDGEIICSKMGMSPDPGQPKWFGVSQIPQQWTHEGGVTSAYHTNYSVGAGSPAAVISGDLELLADIYRQCEIMWDGHNTNVGYYDEERYEGSTPKYFHGWFRTLGMLVCSGNLAAPEDMKPIANAKVYMSVDKTYAYQYDNVTYGVQFRNYGTLAAKDVVVKTKLDPNYEFVSATGNGKYDKGTHSITWNVGSIPGFKTGHLEETMDSVFFTVNVKDTLNKRICLTSTIEGSNFDGWVSNEYPNHATYTMERNCVDILASRSLSIKKTASRKSMNPNDVVSFTVEFENKSEGEDSWMNGGREHVRISYANNPTVQINSFLQFFRFWNDSYESYINMSNYRVSYFMYDGVAKGLYDPVKNKTGWTFKIGNQNDMDKYGYNPPEGPCTFSYQKIPQGQDPDGKKWNQRLMIRFANVLMAPSTHVYDKLNGAYLCHKGVYGPGLIRADLSSNPAADLKERLVDDWSFADNISTMDNGGQQESFYPVTPSWADVNNLGYDINNFTRHVCEPSEVKNFDRVLVEEFDGYTWRRIQGRGPLPGKEAYNVTIADTIPYELLWVGWNDSTALKDDAGNKIQATYTPAANPKADGYTGIVHWTIPEMLVGEKDKLVYTCKARDLGCPDVDDAFYKNVAWIWSDTDSPDSSQVELMTTCAELPPVIDPQASLFKTADKTGADVGESVSYELEFKNTDGTRVDANCKSTNGWKTLGNGTMPKIGSDGLVMSTQTGSYFCAPEYSYGKEGSTYVKIKGASNSSSLYIVFRYKGGTPGEADFKGACIQLNVNNDGPNNLGYTVWDNGTMVATGQGYGKNTQFPGDEVEPTFKFTIKDNHLYVYCNDEEDEWTSTLKDWAISDGDAGYFGLYSKQNNGDPQVTQFITELDYAFNITLYDDVPTELKVSTISDDGKYDETTRRITWPTVAKDVEHALKPNESIKYTYEAEVVECNKKFINNLALATVYGKDTLKVVNTIDCGAVVSCPLEKVTLKSASDVFCSA
ncbi:MAG: glycosyl hydrolase family 8, partial [Paludibacteraceae bacterium]|nr:glycosyl hydrolase family 8 [Paludibacteraceae bacterium]